jgi:hypothetical protein
MKRLALTSIFGLAIVAVLGFGLIPSLEQKASCAECDTNNLGVSEAKKVFDSFSEECGKKVDGGDKETFKCFAVNIYNQLIPIMKTFAKDNRFGPGDRILFIGETQRGNLFVGADRAFQSGAPMAKDSLTVTVDKLRGLNGATVKICTVDDKGVIKKVGQIDFAQDLPPEKKSLTVTGVQGKIVRVLVASFGGALANFKYDLITKQ